MSLRVPAPKRKAPTNRIAPPAPREDRGVDRAHEHLVDREVHLLGVCAPALRARMARFSRTWSNTTTVSYNEYPMMVRRPITVAGETWHRHRVHPAVTTRSWRARERGDRHPPVAEVDRHDHRDEQQEDEDPGDRLLRCPCATTARGPSADVPAPTSYAARERGLDLGYLLGGEGRGLHAERFGADVVTLAARRASPPRPFDDQLLVVVGDPGDDDLRSAAELEAGVSPGLIRRTADSDHEDRRDAEPDLRRPTISYERRPV